MAFEDDHTCTGPFDGNKRQLNSADYSIVKMLSEIKDAINSQGSA